MAIEEIDSGFPGFKSSFLQDAYKAILKRRKAINHFGVGSIELLTDPDDSREWLSLCYNADPALEVEFIEDNRLNIFVRRNRRKQDGKVLLRLDDLRIVRAASRIVELIEYTIWTMDELEGEETGEVKEKIEEKWRSACIGVA